jgi:hypothetical protein
MPLFTLAVTTSQIVDAAGRVTKPEELVVPPDNEIVARDTNVAILAFGVKHAEELAKLDPINAIIHVRQGV